MNKERESNKIDSFVSEAQSDRVELTQNSVGESSGTSEKSSIEQCTNFEKSSSSKQLCPSVNRTPCSVSVWEIILITLGAISLFGAGLLGLIVKSYANKYDPSRAEIVARSSIDYKLPGGSQGVASNNIGAEKFAVVKNNSNPPDLILSVSATPIDRSADELESFPSEAISILENTDGTFASNISYREERYFCGQKRSVTIEEGQHTPINSSTPVPAVKYIVKTTEDNMEYAVNILAIGKDAQTKATKTLSSLKCKF